MTAAIDLVRKAALVNECEPNKLILPDESDLDAYIQALEWRRAIIERVAAFEELVAKEKEHVAKSQMLSHQLEHCEHWRETEPWKVLEVEGKRDGALAAARKCRMMIDQMEREARAYHLKLKTMVGGNG